MLIWFGVHDTEIHRATQKIHSMMTQRKTFFSFSLASPHSDDSEVKSMLLLTSTKTLLLPPRLESDFSRSACVQEQQQQKSNASASFATAEPAN
jgi:hypothetical protein